MLIKRDEEYLISIESRLAFLKKLNYISKLLSQTTQAVECDLDKVGHDYFTKADFDPTTLSQEDYEYHTSEIEILKEEASNFPQILYKSLIVSTYSVFETMLNQLRNEVERTIPHRVKFKDLKSTGSEISNFKNFLDVIYNVDFAELKGDYEFFNNYAAIRNNIVHKNGNLQEDNDNRKRSIQKFVNESAAVTIDSKKQLVFESTFVEGFITFCRRIGLKTIDSIKIKA